ncbi:hypothetical protein FVER53590_04464 [Fusarium verticillioides]|nr:hypothetical protein FVER53590_04464 [Fusarium verticillioides]
MPHQSGRIIFLLEADPDYSADYALALAAITTFAVHKATNQSAVHIKVATVSWEPIHPVTRRLFQQYLGALGAWGSISEFLLTKSEPLPANPVVLKDLPSNLLEYGTASNDTGSLCLRFRDAMHDAADLDERNTEPSQWDPWITASTSKGNYDTIPSALKDPGVELQMLHLNADFRLAERLPSYYTVSIFASPTVPRLIFDRRSRQLLHTFLWISESEELQQLSWRFRVQSYHPPDILCLDHFTKHRAKERRLKIRNEHAEGFVIALYDYMEWPRTIWDLLNVVQEKDDVFSLARIRFLFSGITISDEVIPESSKLRPRTSNGDALYAILPQVNYDSRVAHFLSLDTSSLIAMLKVHLAPMLAAANEPLELLHVQKLDSETMIKIRGCLNECSQVCDAGEWVRRSTLWATAGLGGMIDADDNDLPSPRFTTPLADSSIRVLTAVSAWVSKFSGTIDRILRANEMEVEELGKFQESVNDHNYNEISRDLLRAYSQQVAYASKPSKKLQGGELPKLYDFMTKQRFSPNLNLAVIDWNYIFKHEKRAYGVYTHLKRLGDGGTTVCNWTWIPDQVWVEFEIAMELARRWQPRRDKENNDEFWKTKFGTTRLREENGVLFDHQEL